jgi:DNA-directed RNA polymerase specialized sigma24 family protein
MGSRPGEGEGAARAQDRRDHVLLGHLASARASGDVAGTLATVEKLLAPLWPSVRRQIAAALRPERVQADDLDDIGVAAMTRVLIALRNERDLDGSFQGLVRRCVEWAVGDFRRVRSKRAKREELRDPTEMPELTAPEATGLAEQVDGLWTMLVILSARNRGIVIEREVLDLPVALIAKRRRMTKSAVEKACSRALARLQRGRGLATRSELPAT